jgi:hypothetical protein
LHTSHLKKRKEKEKKQEAFCFGVCPAGRSYVESPSEKYKKRGPSPFLQVFLSSPQPARIEYILHTLLAFLGFSLYVY